MNETRELLPGVDASEQQSFAPGFWPSLLNEQEVVAGSREFSQLESCEQGDLYWVEFCPEEGRSLICRESATSRGTSTRLTPAGFSVQSRVHEYGGRSWCLAEEQLFFVNAADQQLYSQHLHDGHPEQLTFAEQSRFIEPLWCSEQQRLFAVEEIHLEDKVENRLVEINPASGAISLLHSSYDFYSGLALNHHGTRLAFIGWNHPHQPWTVTSLMMIDLCSGDCQKVSGNGDEAISQPCFDPSGQLYAMSDRHGWWNLYRYQIQGDEPEAVYLSESDMITAPWSSGLQQYLLTEQETILLKFRHSGCQLWRVRGELSEYIELPEINHIRGLCRRQNHLCLLVAGPDHSLAIIETDLKGSTRTVTGGERPLEPMDCALPQPLQFRQCFGYLYKPRNSACTSDQSMPLIVFLHGGPTAATYPILNLSLQFWTQRGFAVLDLNYRGSSNYGRAYRYALRHRWGKVEIDDIADAVAEVTRNYNINPEQVFVRGNSSGGFSALNALIQLDCFRAGASLYGVTDPQQLNRCTHKFESHYLSWLIGDPDSETERYDAVAPLQNAEKLSCPVIFFQGEKDRVVLPEQTRMMVSAMREKGLDAPAYYYPEEAHGFRKAETRIEVLKLELAFYRGFLEQQAEMSPKVVE